jgi:SET domain-containing protein
MDSFYNNTLFKMDVRPSQIKAAGLGLYALEVIPPDALIGYYEGVLTRDASLLSPYSFEVSPRYFIDAQRYPRCYIAMVNDARNSEHEYNCEFRMESYREIKKRKIVLYSIKEIQPNTELFANYGEDYWNC